SESMWLTRKGLEQATSELVARHKAKRFHAPVWDLCCGVGADAIAMARHTDVTAVDRSAANCLRTLWNADIYGVRDRIGAVCAEVETLDVVDKIVHLDPDRRSVGRIGRGRTLRLEDGSPNLEFLQQIALETRGGAIKVSPAANFPGKFPQAEIELISLHG